MNSHFTTVSVDAQLIQFLKETIVRYAQYRDHKEAMAYAGVAIYAAAAGGLIVSSNWPPPSWGPWSRWFGVVGVTALWAIALSYLKYQLRKRRWAALRVAGCEWVLVRALPDAPMPPEHRDVPRFLERKVAPSRRERFWDYLWPRLGAVSAVDRSLEVYPPILVRAWTNAELRGTDALGHERIVQMAGWVLYVTMVAITLFANPA